MRKADKSDKNLVVDIISESFTSNPSVNAVVKNDRKREKRLKYLAKYAYKTALRRNGVYLSTDKNGVAICYKYNQRKETIGDYWDQLILAITCIGLNRVIKVLKRESYIKKYRPVNGEFLYFWFFGVNEKARGKGAALELKDAILKESENKNLPIYLETSVEKNRIVYERYSFEVYHTWDNKEEGITIWFMRR